MIFFSLLLLAQGQSVVYIDLLRRSYIQSSPAKVRMHLALCVNNRIVCTLLCVVSLMVLQFQYIERNYYTLSEYLGGKCFALVHCCMTILHRVSDKYDMHRATYVLCCKGLDLAWCISC